MSIKTKLRERGLKPFKELAKHGDIRTISRKIGGFIFEYGVGLPVDIGFSIVCLAVSSVAGFFENEDDRITIKDNVIDYSTKKFIPIKTIVKLNEEILPIGTRQDIEFFFDLAKPFTEEDLARQYRLSRNKYHPDREKTGNREKWDECEKLYHEMLWHWFKSDEEKVLTPNYPKLREKSFRFTPKFNLNQMITFNNKTSLITGRIARQASCNLDTYLIIVDETTKCYEVFEKDLTIAKTQVKL